jgi:hypothetical protein
MTPEIEGVELPLIPYREPAIYLGDDTSDPHVGFGDGTALLETHPTGTIKGIPVEFTLSGVEWNYVDVTVGSDTSPIGNGPIAFGYILSGPAPLQVALENVRGHTGNDLYVKCIRYLKDGPCIAELPLHPYWDEDADRSCWAPADPVAYVQNIPDTSGVGGKSYTLCFGISGTIWRPGIKLAADATSITFHVYNAITAYGQPSGYTGTHTFRIVTGYRESGDFTDGVIGELNLNITNGPFGHTEFTAVVPITGTIPDNGIVTFWWKSSTGGPIGFYEAELS